VRLYFLSRDRKVLAFLSGVILLVATGLAWTLRGTQEVAYSQASPLQEVESLLASKSGDSAKWVHTLLAFESAPPESLDARIASAAIPSQVKALATAVCTSLRAVPAEPDASLSIMAHRTYPLPGAREAVAELYARLGKTTRALEYFQRELDRYPSDAVRGRVVAMLARHGEFAALGSLASDPQFAKHYPVALRLKLALHQRDWAAVASRLAEMELASISPLPLVLALSAGFAWLVIVLHCGQPRGWFCFRTIVPLVAVVVGAVGALGVHFVAEWQEEILGVRETGELLPDLAFYAGIVSPREELVKLVLLLPFLPALLLRRDPLETLIVSGCIGLGFAFEDNLQLCRTTQVGEAFLRLLTANFFHFATTALAGAALCELIRSRFLKPLPFVTTLTVVLLAHTIYDVFSRIAVVGSLSWLSIASMLVISKLFFIELRRWRDPFTDQCFLGATLVVCLVGLAATALITTSMHIGFSLAMVALLKNAGSLLFIGLVFYLRFDCELVPAETQATPNP
jgi:PrsW family intramembrane metalloprotease